jgi:hypothetical protein
MATAAHAQPDARATLPEFFDRLGVGGGGTLGTWFSRLATVYLERRARRPQAAAKRAGAGDLARRAERVIRRAAVRSSLGGAAAGGVTTGAELLVAELGPIAALAGIPAAVVAIGGEMLYRALVHIEMCCDLGELYGVAFRADEPWDLWRLYALAFESGRGVVEHPRFEVQRLVEHETKEPSDVISHEILAESVVRNLVPVIGIGISAWRNWQVTREIGETVHRYVRFRRNRRDAFARHEHAWQAHLELIVETFWHVFTAKGWVADEEVAILANYFERLAPEARSRVLARFVDDESPWLARLSAVPEGDRTVIVHALEHAATADMSLLPPERKLLDRAARALGRAFDAERVREMIEGLQDGR